MMTAKQLLKPRFKKVAIEWYEERAIEDMPEWIKPMNTGDEADFVAPVYRIGFDFEYTANDNGEVNSIQFKTGGGLLIHWCLPATEKEYLDYRKKYTNPK